MKPAADLVRAIRKDLESRRNPELAAPMSRYLLNKFPFLGIRTPDLVAAMKPFLSVSDEAVLADVARRLWKLREREYHHAAAYMLHRKQKFLTPVIVPLLRELIQTNSWWDTVDALATRCVGPLVSRYPRLAAEMDAWSVDEDFWIRRTAIIHQLSFREQTDVDRLFGFCVANAADREFFIRKAIGWALRQYARTDARAVVRFVASHPELSSLSKREALKHC
jgi:3-methyladenine DNA glycosylase AlkD